jgi:hypothetical protein
MNCLIVTKLLRLTSSPSRPSFEPQVCNQKSTQKSTQKSDNQLSGHQTAILEIQTRHQLRSTIILALVPCACLSARVLIRIPVIRAIHSLCQCHRHKRRDKENEERKKLLSVNETYVLYHRHLLSLFGEWTELEETGRDFRTLYTFS